MRDIVSPLAGFSSPFGRGADPYAILGYKPPLVLDYENSKFRVSGSTSTAPSVVTATRTGLATQLDASGNLVWNAHNLLRYSEDFTNAAWSKTNTTVTANNTTAPDGALTADDLVENAATGTHNAFISFSVINGASYTAAVFIKAGIRNQVTLRLGDAAFGPDDAVFDLSNGSLSSGNGTISNFGNGWYLCTVSATSGGTAAVLNILPMTSGSFSYAGSDGSTSLEIWGAHAYRSDLGGMAPVPLTRRVAGSTTYVPTTSAAVYLPREEAYTYVSGSLVGPYYQKESDARTNLVTYSEDFTDASWTKISGGTGSNPTVTANSGVSPDGTNNATRVQASLSGGTTNTDFALVRRNVTLAVAEGESTYSLWVKSNTESDQVITLSYAGVPATITATSVWQRFNVFPNIAGSINECDVGLRGDTTDNSCDVLIYGAQLEQGSTPTSYIPTSGSTVTRSADSTTISAGNMPYPTPQVIGPELVTNGTFDTDSDWTKGAGWTISGGQASHVAGSATLISQTVSLTLGKVYKATCDVVSVSGGTGSLQFRSGGTTTGVTLDAGQAGTTVEVLYVAEGNTQIAVFAGSGTNITIDNISVREINPLALSFQMEGLMTGESSTFADWTLDANNGIQITSGASDFTFTQEAAGVVDSVTGGSYTSDINVPFNIASRHGSTFINGAVDGTALTADTTPTALPDLSATTFDLAPTFNGFIKEFRVWADDIGDTGIAEAST